MDEFQKYRDKVVSKGGAQADVPRPKYADIIDEEYNQKNTSKTSIAYYIGDSSYDIYITGFSVVLFLGIIGYTIYSFCKKKTKNILTPFFQKEKHNFLLEKWWFRGLIVLYSVGLILLTIFGISFFGSISTTLSNFGYSRDDMIFWLGGIIGAMNFIFILHYLVSFFVLKIFIDFVVLGGKQK